MICTKAYSLTVATGLMFEWTPATILPSGLGTASFTPDNAPGNTGIAAVTIASVPGESGFVLNDGVLIPDWNSVAVLPCNLHINITTVGSNPNPSITWLVQVLGGGFLVNESWMTLGLNGSFDVPFSLPNTGGVDLPVSWHMEALMSSNPNAGGSIILEGIFTIV